MTKAELFWDGQSQAVRLPEGYQFEGQEVEIERVGDTLVLKPAAQTANVQSKKDQWAWLRNMPKGHIDQDFIDAVEDPGVQQERPGLDDLFK